MTVTVPDSLYFIMSDISYGPMQAFCPTKKANSLVAWHVLLGEGEPLKAANSGLEFMLEENIMGLL